MARTARPQNSILPHQRHAPSSATVINSLGLSSICYYLLRNQVPHLKKKKSRKPSTMEERVFKDLLNTHTDLIPHLDVKGWEEGPVL